MVKPTSVEKITAAATVVAVTVLAARSPVTPVTWTAPRDSAMVNSTASAGQLASTRAATSVPLTAGLVALGAGTILTPAGHRRLSPQS